MTTTTSKESYGLMEGTGNDTRSGEDGEGRGGG